MISSWLLPLAVTSPECYDNIDNVHYVFLDDELEPVLPFMSKSSAKNWTYFPNLWLSHCCLSFVIPWDLILSSSSSCAKIYAILWLYRFLFHYFIHPVFWNILCHSLKWKDCQCVDILHPFPWQKSVMVTGIVSLSMFRKHILWARPMSGRHINCTFFLA